MYECKYCKKSCKNNNSLLNHEIRCKENPNKSTYRFNGIQSTSGKHFHGLLAYSESRKLPLEEILVENSTYARHNLKRRLIKENLLEYKCSCCGIGDVWNNSTLVLQLDHINGVNNDHRIENLRFLCPNCHSQQDTYAAKNRKNNPNRVPKKYG